MYSGLEVDRKRGDLGNPYVGLELELLSACILDCYQLRLIVIVIILIYYIFDIIEELILISISPTTILILTYLNIFYHF